MIRKLSCTTAAFLAGLVLWTPLHSGANAAPGHVVQSQPEKADPKPKAARPAVFLKCEWETFKDIAGIPRQGRAVITNNTSNPIPGGAVIEWSVRAETRGQITLGQSLPARGTVRSTIRSEFGGPVNPRAWYFK